MKLASPLLRRSFQKLRNNVAEAFEELRDLPGKNFTIKIPHIPRRLAISSESVRKNFEQTKTARLERDGRAYRDSRNVIIILIVFLLTRGIFQCDLGKRSFIG